MGKCLTFIDLFAGIGGLRTGFEEACQQYGFKARCLMTSEIKEHAINVLNDNFPHENIVGDITQVTNSDIPDFDILLAGFPCQAFSSAGNRHGFLDTRGTLFFEVERILRDKKPAAFILENVEGLIKHDLEHPKEKIGRTLKTIIHSLEELDYKVNWKLLDSIGFGVPQSRKRIFIVGSHKSVPDLDGFLKKDVKFGEVMENGLPTSESQFTKLLLKYYSTSELKGKHIKDKRGGERNIHSWDFCLKGKITKTQKELINTLFKQRRRKKWAKAKGIDWMDGMPLTLKEISTFFPSDSLYSKDLDLKGILDDLVTKDYLRLEHPRKMVSEETECGNFIRKRVPDVTLEKGYNITTGKLSFKFNLILDPNGIVPTIVATDVSRIGVIDGKGIRQLTLTEGLRCFGFPKKFKLETTVPKGFDLLGNTVVVPVVKGVASRMLETLYPAIKAVKVNGKVASVEKDAGLFAGLIA